jgi:hypothetical protein
VLTLFTTAKPFLGHSGVIQRNALRSWSLLHPDVEVILFGDEEGAAEVAGKLGVRHEPLVERHDSGLKRIDYMFDRAQEIARHDVLCYVNCDIILLPEFCEAVRHVSDTYAAFLMVGRRWDTEIARPVNFSNSGWSHEIRQVALKTNDRRDGWWIDYFCFSRKLYHRQIPAFVIGRVCWDNWLVWKAIDSGAAVVDASSLVFAVHQNHGYSYHPMGKQGIWTDELSKRNFTLAGGWRHLRTIGDATTRLTANGIKPNRTRYWHATAHAWKGTGRVLTFDVWLPVWHIFLDLSRPLRARLGLRSKLFRQPTEADPSPARKLP